MTFTYDPTSDIGKVRMMIPDRVGSDALLTDEEIEAYLDMNGDDVRYAAADALDMIASDQALTLKVITLMDLRTDGRATAQSLMERADKLRTLADNEDAAAEAEDGGLLDYGEMVVDEFTKRERVLKQAEREDL
ncbi:MAG: hypothetical protein C4583_04345 [Anaerolineaceae bacterium]|nr:MAG: hypothetical protein C4583_04345 [Anaerolineaceae bacterium]